MNGQWYTLFAATHKYSSLLRRVASDAITEVDTPKLRLTKTQAWHGGRQVFRRELYGETKQSLIRDEVCFHRRKTVKDVSMITRQEQARFLQNNAADG